VHFVNIGEGDHSGQLCTTDPQRIFSHSRDPVEAKKGLKKVELDNSAFVIPELPSGKVIEINILSTWGDPFYVGLNGIEMFDRTGHVITLNNVEQQIWANPADINVLPEYGK
jgi:hypothetical protein